MRRWRVRDPVLVVEDPHLVRVYARERHLVGNDHHRLSPPGDADLTPEADESVELH